MEEERDSEFFLPPKLLLKRVGELGAEFSPFSAPDKNGVLDRMTRKVTQRFANVLEGVTGPLYLLEDDFYYIPARWGKIINLLHRNGILKEPSLLFKKQFNDMPKLYMMSLPIHPQKAFNNGPIHGGSSFNFEEAVSKTVGEFLERYMLSFARGADAERVQKFSVRQLSQKKAKFLHPRAIAGFSNEQRSSRMELMMDGETVFSWVWGKGLFMGEKVLLPAQCVFWDFNPSFQEPLIRESNSNGGAGMFSRDEAILHGIRELVERDAFLLFWLNTLAPPRIDTSTIRYPDTEKIIRIVKRYGFNLDILDITSDLGLFTCVAVLTDTQKGMGGCSVGTAAGANAEQVIKKAIVEAIVAYAGARKTKTTLSLSETYIPFSVPFGLEDRSALWFYSSAAKYMRWFLEGKLLSLDAVSKKHGLKQTFSSDQELEFLIEAFKRKGPGYELYYYEAWNPLLSDIGYSVVKVIAPMLTPFYGYERNAPLGAPRLAEVPSRIGYSRTAFPNPRPHPLT